MTFFSKCCCFCCNNEDKSCISDYKSMNDSKNKLLILLNPNSGGKTAIQSFNNKVAPALKENNIDYELIVTEGRNHSFEIAKRRDDLLSFNAIIIVSGDGLIFEWLNGICERADKLQILESLPVGIVPCGSGNGLLASVLAYHKNSLNKKGFENRAIQLINSKEALSSKVNLMHIEAGERHMAAFLSVGWGLLADIDIESERWRSTLGQNRFTAGAIVRTIKLKTYNGTLWYLPRDQNEVYEDGNKSYDKVYSDQHRRSSKTSSDDISHSEYINNHTLLSIQETDRFSNFHIYPNIPPIKDVIPSNWIKIKENFVFVYAVTISHISRENIYMPKAQLDDANIYLTYCLKKDLPSRFSLLKMLTAIENGNHLDLPFVKTIPVHSFRLEPIDQGSFLVLDGEVIAANSIQATITNLKMKIVSHVNSEPAT